MAAETRRYQLTNCTGQISPLYTEQDLSQYLGSYVAIQESLQCYLVSEVGCEIVKISFSYDGDSYSYDVPRTGVQNGFGYYSLTITVGEFNQITIFWDNTPANLSEYGWRVNIRNTGNDFSINRFNSTNECPLSSSWDFYSDGSEFEVDGLEVDYIQDIQTVDVEYCYLTCEECSTKAYRVYSCSSEFEIFSTDPRLELIVSEDQVVRIPFYNDGCFRAEQVSYDRTRTYIPVLDYSGIYNNCIDCYPRETVEPLVEFGICDSQKVIDIKCNFAEMMYQQMMSRRLGIEFCCPIEKGKATLKNDIIDFALLPDELPDLPEPYVEYCCIPITTDNCPPTPCSTCTETVVEVVNCNCTASENSPHPCHTYQVTVLGNQLLLATGNTNGSLNGKVYFAYFKCKATKPTVVEYTTAQTNPYCVLGIPVFGYYANNEWVTLPLTRGEECPEEEITNTCCND